MDLFRKIIITLALLLPVVSHSQDSHPDSIYKRGERTYLQAIDFSSPQTVAKAFISAWRGGDYITFYALLGNDAKAFLIRKMIFLRDFDGLFLGESECLEKALYAEYESERAELSLEYAHDFNRYVDDLFVVAEKNDALPFTIGPGAAITDSSVNGQNRMSLVTIRTDSEREPQIRLTLKLHLKRWKIEFIELPNSEFYSPLWGNATFPSTPEEE